MSKPIVIYTTLTCPYCHAMTDFLDKLGAKYEERNADDPIVEGEAAAILGHRIEVVPTMIIDGEIIEGYDRRRVKKLLKARDGGKKEK